MYDILERNENKKKINNILLILLLLLVLLLIVKTKFKCQSQNVNWWITTGKK